MGGRAVLGVGGVLTPAIAAEMAGDALAGMQDLHRRPGQPDVDLGPDELVGDAVVVVLDLDVVVDVHAGLLPLGELIALEGKGLSAGRSSFSNSDRREPSSF